MFDHVGFNVSDFARSKAFYLAALKPLGMELMREADNFAVIGNASGGSGSAFLDPPRHRSTLPSGRTIAKRPTLSIPLRSPRVGATTADRGCAPTTAPTTTPPSSTTPTGTTSRLSHSGPFDLNREGDEA
jgi:catechol 2,3-dioxygenase-like lactoylglutathione lyase family enzyme